MRHYMITILLTLLMFTRLDGHKLWIDPATGLMIQGAGQLGYPTGTKISVGGEHTIVRENVNEVVRAIRKLESHEPETK